MFVLAACSGEIGDSSLAEPAPGTADAIEPSLPGVTPAIPRPDGPAAPEVVVHRSGLQRLNNTEYDNTIADLLGIPDRPARSFIADEKAFGFDNIAAAQSFTDAHFEQYIDAADALVDRALADAQLRARIAPCTPASADDLDCVRRVIRAFGPRAFRRPVTDAEVERLAELATVAGEAGADGQTALGQVIKAMLVSVPFLYRVELDSNPATTAPARLGGYELASRLSYLVWSTMPDARSFELAGRGELAKDDVLEAELTRMLADPKASALRANFAGQWLGLRDLESHQVEPTVFADWDDALRDAMIREAYAYVDEFLKRDRSLREFFTAAVGFNDTRLARHYGSGTRRVGFLGLGSFLTVSSFSYRTAPTLRGKWVLENLLCQEIPQPPPNIPQLEPEMSDPKQAQSLNVRERLAEHRNNPQCASCHDTLDPIGLGLEHFDAIGRERSTYVNGDAIDASGRLPDGSSFDGARELATLLADDPRLARCAVEKLLTYALSRELVPADAPYRARLLDTWQRDGLKLPALLRRIVQSEPFRSRAREGG